MDKIVVNIDEVDEYIYNMKKYLDDYNAILNGMRNIKNNLVWECNTKDKFIQNYDEMLNEYVTFIENLNRYINYLDKYTSKYRSE